MPRVRLRAPCRAAEAVLPGCLAHLRIGEIAMDVRHLLGERIPGPDALRAAEVGDAGVGGDARPGERDEARRLAHPGADLGYDFRIHFSMLPPCPPPISGASSASPRRSGRARPKWFAATGA